ELHGRLVEPGSQALELAQRRPLRLADGLPGRLDEEVGAHLRAFFFRRTIRGWPGGGGFGSFAPSPASPSPRSFGGVRDVRFSGGAGFGVSRRVTSPCPTVQRFVV